jgi:hypothetical protein
MHLKRPKINLNFRSSLECFFGRVGGWEGDKMTNILKLGTKTKQRSSEFQREFDEGGVRGGFRVFGAIQSAFSNAKKGL